MALPALPGVVSVQPQTTRAPLRPILSFPSVWWDSDSAPPDMMDMARFPERNEQAYRNNHRCVFGSLAFLSALRTAQILRVVDPKFDRRDGAEPLERALRQSGLVQVRLLTGSHQGAQEWCTKMRKLLGERAQSGVPVVEWKTTLEAKRVFEVHDRFALVDDELWHFGATVGGAHRSINAYSRGWDAGKTRAIEFFEEAWNHA